MLLRENENYRHEENKINENKRRVRKAEIVFLSKRKKKWSEDV